jgi:hypothetical protein
MGRTARFEQIYVANLDAEPVEEETLTGVKSILTSEIAADEIVTTVLGIANTAPTKDFSLGSKLFMDKDDIIVFDLKERGRASRFFVDNQLGIGTTNPTKAFQVNSGDTRKVDIDITGRDLMTVSGNLVASNLIIQNNLVTPGSNLIVNDKSSNVLSIVGGIKTSNLYVGSNVSMTDQGSNVMKLNGNIHQTGYLTVLGNIAVTGNITVTETATYIATQDLRVSNVVIHSAFGNDVLSRETAFVMTPGAGYSNVAIGFVAGDRGREMAIFHSDVYGGYNAATINVDDTKVVNVHVYGDIYTSNNIGANNTYPTHDLCVGSNVFIEDTGSNVIHATGNIYATGVRIGTGGLQVGSLLTMAPGTETPAIISGNVQMNALRTNDAAPSGFANLSPTDTLSIGTKIFANTSAINSLRVLGNTSTTNLTTEMTFSSSNLVIHADRFGGDSTSNVLILKSGPTASNVSSIEVYGASTSNTHQNIRFKTKNTERVRITSDGRMGIANTNPTERLTVSGNIYITGSNTLVHGNIWGTTGNTSMRSYSLVNSGENKIENIVGTGKGLNFYASTTATMGTPKLTILESSNVGIGTGAPESSFHVNGLTTFINNQVTKRNGYSHLGTPLVATNTSPITSTTDLASVLTLAREGSGTEHGARATFKLGKHESISGTSKTRVDIYLGHDDYAVDTGVMTLLSSGKVGIGHTQPTAHLEVKCEGIADPTDNGILVHNHESGDAIIAAQTDLADGNSFSSYIQTDGATLSGWTVGVSGTNGDFRITNDHEKVSESSEVGLYIDGTTHAVGIGTDSPRGALEVFGNVVIGQQLTFSGLSGDDFGNTHIIERRYNTDYSKTELLLFKGNEASSVDEGPDRIRHIAGEHVFQTYTSSGETLYGTSQILEDLDGQTDKPLVICDNGLVVVGGQRSDADSRGANTKLVVNGDVEFGGGGSFKLTGFEFSTTSGGSSRNIVRSKLNGATRRPITFVHEIDDNNDSEFARFDGDGKLGLGTDSPSSNIHIYDTTSGNIDLLRLESGGANKETGMLIFTDSGEGGYVRGFSNSTNGTTGLVMGVSNNSTETNCIHLLHTSNVGIGTNKPATKLHLYNSVPRVESSSSNALIEFKTTGGTSNIYSDTTGNVYINPSATDATLFVKGDLDIESDLVVGGAIDFGNQVAVDLGGATANTALHVGGGIITNSNQVACKRYSQTFQIGEGVAKDIQLMFGTGAFYAKVTAILRRTDNSTVQDLSTMILELQGGTSDDTSSTLDIAIGTKNLFGGTNSYPWSPTVTTGIRGISITPYNTDSTRIYNYDIFVELVSACNGKLVKITRDLSAESDLDSATGGQTEITTFNY